MTEDNKFPGITASFDQFGALAKDWAGVIVIYFKALLAGGFTREEALAITLAYQRETLTRMFNPPKEPS